MIVYKILFLIFLIISTLFAFFGFYQSGLLYMEIVVTFCMILWIFLSKKIPSICFLSSIIITVSGILLGVNLIFMVLYCGLSLGIWDITLMELQISGNAERAKVNLYNFMRFISLGLTLIISFIIIFIFRFINLNFPFFIIIILVISCFFCIYRIIDIFNKR